MSFPPVWDESHFKHDEASRVEVRERDKRDAERNERDVYRHVNQRDGYRCRVCQIVCDPTAPDLLRRGHHHHVVFRSALGPTTTENVVLLCARCHADVQAHRVYISGNADVALTIERRNAVTDEWYVSKQETAPGVIKKD